MNYDDALKVLLENESYYNEINQILRVVPANMKDRLPFILECQMRNITNEDAKKFSKDHQYVVHAFSKEAYKLI